mmetsp:Transcript_69645/g.203852  ORF Transcript_69645/g.203852 Transcript_69645/m.203852 type:complete len:120 (-) Transcript_69645:39-398(-)
MSRQSALMKGSDTDDSAAARAQSMVSGRPRRFDCRGLAAGSRHEGGLDSFFPPSLGLEHSAGAERSANALAQGLGTSANLNASFRAMQLPSAVPGLAIWRLCQSAEPATIPEYDNTSAV